jgi:hypothetical protein
MKFVFGMKYYFTQSVKGSFTPLLRSVAPLIKWTNKLRSSVLIYFAGILLCCQ